MQPLKCVLALLVLCSGFTTTANAGYTFTSIADTQGQFSNFETTPAINNDGVVAFLGYFDFAAGGGSGIFIGDGLTQSQLASSGDSFLALGGGVAINDNRKVAFRGYVGSFFRMGIFTATEAGGPQTVALNDAPFSDFGAYPAINANGMVAFFGNRSQNGTFVGSGIYSGDSAGYSAVFEKDTAWAIGTGVDINSKGVVTGALTDPNTNTFIFKGTVGDNIVSTAPGSKFKSLNGVPSINDREAIAYIGTVRADDSSVVQLHPPDDIEREIATTAGDSMFTVFNYPVVNNNDQVAFLAGFGSSSDVGIFTGSDPDADSVIRTGDELFGGVVKSVRFSQGGLNDNGELAFYYQMTNGSVGLAVASPGQLTRKVNGGQSYGGVRIRSDQGSGLTARLRGGLASVDQAVDLSFVSKTNLPTAGLFTPFGDVLSLSGMNGELFVLELSYTDGDLASAGIQDESRLVIQWLDPFDKVMKNAVLGNTPFPGGKSFFGTNYATYLQSQNGVPNLGDYGNSPQDNTIWAVLNHNSLFAAAAPVTPDGASTVPAKTVADLTTENPLGGGVYTGFSTDDYSPALENGLVAFVGGNSVNAGSYFTVSAAGGSISPVVKYRDIIPGEPSVPTPTFYTFGGYSLDHGSLAFVGGGWMNNFPATVLVGGIYTTGGGTLKEVANTHSPVPNSPGSFIATGFGAPSADGGQMAFYAGNTINGNRGIYVTTPTGLFAVADSFTIIPETTNTFPGGFAFDPSFNKGDVAFSAQLRPSGSATEGIFKTIGGATNVLQRVVDYTFLVPGSTEHFGVTATPVMSDGQIAFWGRTATFSKTGIYTTIGGGIRLVADQNTAIPGGTGNFIAFDNNYSLAIKGGRILFLGYGNNSFEGIYLWEAGQLTKIVDSNDQINGRTVRHLFFGKEAFDGTGVVFVANFAGAFFKGVYTIPINPPLVVPTELILKIAALTPGSVRLSWLTSVIGARLQSSTNLQPGSWSGVLSTVTQANGENVVVENVDTAKRFYRLIQP